MPHRSPARPASRRALVRSRLALIVCLVAVAVAGIWWLDARYGAGPTASAPVPSSAVPPAADDGSRWYLRRSLWLPDASVAP